MRTGSSHRSTRLHCFPRDALPQARQVVPPLRWASSSFDLGSSNVGLPLIENAVSDGDPCRPVNLLLLIFCELLKASFIFSSRRTLGWGCLTLLMG
mmetsp:Transcript_13758/g.50092  ORF Transcript_13758/g.50092 Transcript_13758/m.50092 type:complete len:96 (-) Transcript_13758:2906-3193(-)